MAFASTSRFTFNTNTGVIEQKFEIKKDLYHVLDVGGEQFYRRKWIHCFELVTAVIFTASLSCYDAVMFEDEDRNSMVDQIELFEQICNNEWFKETAMILFLNKKDLFAQKIQSIPITVCPAFHQFNGDTKSYEDTTFFIKEIFESQKAKNSQKPIFTHFTCAIDKKQFKKLFENIHTPIIEAYISPLFA